MTVEQIQTATKKDEVLCKFKLAIQTDQWDTTDPAIMPYLKCADQLTLNTCEDVILKADKIFIPHALRKQALALAHTGHQGIEKTKSLLRTKIWYPKMDVEVTELIDNCPACQAVTKGNPPELLQTRPTSDTPWSELTIDFYGPIPQAGKYLLSLHRYVYKVP